jgi:hypothetical protein
VSGAGVAVPQTVGQVLGCRVSNQKQQSSSPLVGQEHAAALSTQQLESGLSAALSHLGTQLVSPIRARRA